MTPGYDPRTCCTGCNSPSGSTQGACEDCGKHCCSECAELVDRPGNPSANDLVCKACFARRVEVETGCTVEEVAEPYRLEPAAQGVLYPELAPKPMRVSTRVYREEVA